MEWINRTLESLKNLNIYGTRMDYMDCIEILIIAWILYYILVWMKSTRAWTLLRGLILICIFLLVARVLEMTTIIWIAQNVLGFAVTALIVVLQPELRKALEELGKSKLWRTIIPFVNPVKEEDLFSEKTIEEITRACVEMGRAKTGALIVIEQQISLKDYEKTGIDVDALVSCQLLINIFEKNTPLHDGAVIVRGNRVTSATCYLPLSDNLSLSKDLGTRHRAGVGISEATDSLTIIVSEENGKISVAYDGVLERDLNADRLRRRMQQILNKSEEEPKAKRKWIGRSRNKE